MSERENVGAKSQVKMKMKLRNGGANWGEPNCIANTAYCAHRRPRRMQLALSSHLDKQFDVLYRTRVCMYPTNNTYLNRIIASINRIIHFSYNYRPTIKQRLNTVLTHTLTPPPYITVSSSSSTTAISMGFAQENDDSIVFSWMDGWLMGGIAGVRWDAEGRQLCNSKCIVLLMKWKWRKHDSPLHCLSAAVVDGWMVRVRVQ